MGRKRRQPTKLIRVRTKDLVRLREFSRTTKIKIPDIISRLTRRMGI